jgi:putative MATE family efflux protein
MTLDPSEDKPPGGRPSFGRDLTVGSIPRHLILFSLPMLAGNLFQTAYSFINAFWVGKRLGDQALAAVTVSFPVVFVLASLANGMTIASTILVSQHFGARDMASVKRVVRNSTVLFTVLGAVLLVVGEILAPQILRAMNTPPDVLPLAVEYLRIFLLGVPMSVGAYSARSLLQGIGDSTTPLYFLAGSVLLTAGLDPVLMFGWLGMPKLGLNGTAWASGIAQLLTVVALVGWLRKRGNPVAPRWGWRGFHWPTAWTTITIGLPSALQQSVVSMGMTFVMGIVSGFGTDALAAFGAAMRVDQLAFMPAFAFGLAISPLAGQNIGANRHHRVRSIFLWGCLLSGGITLAVSVLVVSLPRAILSLFINGGPVMDIGENYLRTVAPFYLFFAIMFVSNGIINGSGHTLVTTIISLLSQWAFRVPIAYYLARRLGSVQGVWYAMAISFGVSMFSSLGYYLTGLWRRPVIRRRPPAPASSADLLGEETGEA